MKTIVEYSVFLLFCFFIFGFGKADVCDTGGGNEDRGFIDCVSFGEKYSEFQWAVCLAGSDISKDVKINARCRKQQGKVSNCWYPCELAAHNREKGRVSEICQCNKYNDKHFKSGLKSTCFIHTEINIGNCDWFKTCLEKKLKEILQCNTSHVRFMVDNGERLCKVHKSLFSAVPRKKSTGLQKVQECIQSPVMPLLFQKSSTACSSMVADFKHRVRQCFTNLMTYWICDLPNEFFSNSRAKAYKTMKSELKEILGEDVDVGDHKWYDFWKLPCDTKFIGPGVTHFLVTIKHQQADNDAAMFANSIGKVLHLQDRHVLKEAKVFHESSKLLFLEVAIFPQEKFDWFTKVFGKAPDMKEEEEKMLLLVNEKYVPIVDGTGGFEILQVMKCTTSTSVCSKGGVSTYSNDISKCEAAGGYCIQSTAGTCPGIDVENGMCITGEKCCIDKDEDTVCLLIGGSCIEDYMMCKSGSIVNAKCGAQRHCCLQFYIERFIDDCSEPKIISRDSWGARKAVTENPVLRTPVPYFMIHNTAGDRCSGLQNCAKWLTEYQRYHVYDHGWRDLGYNFLIDDDGNVYEATGWGRRGIHSNDFNPYSHAASFFGNFQIAKTLPTKKATDSLAKLVKCGVSMKMHDTDFKYLGHRDVRSKENTDCPGITFYKELVKWERYSFTAVVDRSSIEDDQECKDADGECRDITVFPSCENGTYVEKTTKRCIGHTNRKCCVQNGTLTSFQTSQWT